MVFLTAITLIFQIYIMTELTQFSIKNYIFNTLKPAIFSTIVAVLPLIILKLLLPSSILFTIILFIISLVWTITSIYILGLNINEKRIIKDKVKLILKRF